MNWINQHVTHIIGGGAGGVGLAYIFRDAIGKGWESFWRDRREARTERMAAAGSGDKYASTIVQMFTQGLNIQHEDNKTLHAILDRMATGVERLAERQDQFNRKQDEQSARIDRWERSRGIN